MHFPIDSLVGYRLGTLLARLLLALADPRRRPPAPLDAAAVYAGDHQLRETDPRPAGNKLGSYALSPAPQLAAMWKQVQAEVAGLRV